MVGSFFNRILIPSSSADPCSRACRVALLICCCLSVLVESSLGSKTRHFKWEVEYMYWSPDCVEGVVLGINGQFLGPTIHARAGDIVNVELKKKLSTEGVVIHWHGIRQQGTPWADGTASISQCVINPGETFVYRFKVERGKGMERRGFSTQYTKPLNPPAIAFSTKEGEAMLSEAIAEGTAFGSLKLFENFRMQRDLNFCGPASLCTVLNALRVDPNRAWKGRNLRNKIIGFLETSVGGFCSTNVSELGGFCSMTLNLRELSGPWRWFEDPMIADSEIMEKVQKKGISFDRLAELARKHVDIEAFKAQHSSFEQFTNCVIQTTSTEELYMILSYSRKMVNQTGDGHFSPMAAYHKGKDMLLILDVARYKYPFHWLPRMMVWDAMNEIDKETGETRGFMMVRKKIS